jgi:predicted nicotinamide N-methyase
MADLPDPDAFIRANLPLAEVPGTGLRLHLAGPRSGLSRLVPPGGTPFWAHAWPGGVALAMHLVAQPETILGREVVEIGTGSGLVSIAALRAGAVSATAFDTDPLAAVATRINAEANGVGTPQVHIGAPEHLLLDPGSVLGIQGRSVVLAGDVFYDATSARLSTAALDAAGAALGRDAVILVGDIGRRFLPRERLEPLASYPVRDLGDPPSAPLHDGWVFRWKRLP